MRKLDLGCGDAKPEGYEGADIVKLPSVDHVFDIMQFPWPFEDESFDELRTSHYIEHIPQAFHTPNPRFPIAPNTTAVAEGPHSVSLFLKFFAECWRVLKPGGKILVICPHGRSDRAFQDPTHTRFIVESSFDYLDHEWRKTNKLQHAAYGADALLCHFPVAQQHRGAGCNEIQARVLRLMPDAPNSAADGSGRSVQDVAVSRYWNMISDFNVTLVKAPIPAAVEESAKVPAAEPQEVTA